MQGDDMVLTAADIAVDPRKYRSWGLTTAEYDVIKGILIGETVGQPWLTPDALQRGGYSSWKEYFVAKAIQAW